MTPSLCSTLLLVGALGAAPAQDPRAPLSDRGRDNLMALTRILGVVEHFHPSDEALALDWDQFSIHAMEQIEAATSASDLADRLDRLFWPVAPSVHIWEGTREDEPDREPLDVEGATHRVGIVHLGLGPAKNEEGQRSPNSLYQSTIVREAVDLPAAESRMGYPRRDWCTELPGGVSVRVPLVVLANEHGTLPEGLESEEYGIDRPSGWQPSGNDRATRFAAVADAWNIMQHFYPYFDVVAEGWKDVLPASLERAATDRDEREFFATLSRLVAAIEDGHGNTYHASTSRGFVLPMRMEFVDEELVVTYADATTAGSVQPGDVVVAVDGREVAQLYAEEAALILLLHRTVEAPQGRRHSRLGLGSLDRFTAAAQAVGRDAHGVRPARAAPHHATHRSRPREWQRARGRGPLLQSGRHSPSRSSSATCPNSPKPRRLSSTCAAIRVPRAARCSRT